MRPFLLIWALGSFALLTRFSSLAEQARPADSFVESIGVNTHLGYGDTIYAEYDKVIRPRLLELGVRHIRDGTFSPPVARKYLDLSSNGVHLLLITHSTRVPRQALEVLPALFALEGMNEPDTREGWVERTRLEQAALYATVKTNPVMARLPVLVSSLANIRDNPAKLGDLSAVLDFGNLHPYAAGQAPSRHWGWGTSMEQAIAAAQKVSAGKPIIVTECGYHNRTDETGHPGCSESAAARYFPRLFLVYFNRGIVRSYSYEFADEKPDPEFRDKEQHFGLIRRDGTVKPAYTAIRNLITLLKDPGPSFTPGTLDYVLSGQTNLVHHTLLQKRDGRFVLLLWQEAQSYDPKAKHDISIPEVPVQLEFARECQSAVIHLPTREAAPVRRQDRVKRLQVAVPDEVLLLELTP